MTVRILIGHVIDRLKTLPDECVHCVVCSPPYYGLRDYGIEPQVWGGDGGCKHEWGDDTRGHNPGRSDHGTGDPTSRLGPARDGIPGGSDQGRGTASTGAFCLHCNAWRGSLGLEPTPALYIEHMVAVFREVRRVLRRDGTCWINIGDSYAAGKTGRTDQESMPRPKGGHREGSGPATGVQRSAPIGVKPKDLLGIPWMLAFALRDDGWYLRSEITWAKRAPMPESVTDRPTSATEKVFLFAKSARYFYDAEAVKEEAERAGDIAGGNYSVKGLAAGVNGKWASGEVPGKRNMRNWWLLGPEPNTDWAPDFEHADYVDDRGIPRKVSPSCPIHGQGVQPQSETHATVSYGVQPTDPLIDSRRIGSDRVPSPNRAAEPTTNYRVSPPLGSRSDESRGSIGESKISEDHSAGSSRKSDHSRHTHDVPAASTNDSLRLGDFPKTSDRNTPDYKTDRLLSASLHDSASVQTASRTPSTSPALFENLPDQHTAESNTSRGEKVLLARKSGDRSGISSSYAKCSCPISQVAHFATFPTEIPRRAILAGTSEKGVCPKCAAGLERVVEVNPEYAAIAATNKGWSHAADQLVARQKSDHPSVLPWKHKTIGWRPTCLCDAGDSIPATVLDPFLGAGTTALVADRLGRHCIGIELSAEYAAMAERRIRGDAPLFADITTEGDLPPGWREQDSLGSWRVAVDAMRDRLDE